MDRIHREAGARTSRSSSSTTACTPSACASPPPCTAPATTDFIATKAAAARDKGVSGYPADGTNRWAAVHRTDAAHLVTLGLGKAPAGACLHAVAEEGIPTREIAEAIGRAFDLPVTSVPPDDVAGHFGWISTLFAMDLPATSTATRELLGWTPTAPTLIEDIDTGAYS